jgi:hypothetical protein
MLVHDEASPQGDQQRSGVLDQESDADVEALDRGEVRPLNQREAKDAEGRPGRGVRGE